MSCHGCATKFGLWTKESGCSSCGFSFCNSCLKHKGAVPKHDNRICKVCKKCFDSLLSSRKESAGIDMTSSRAPPDSFLKRLEALDSPPKPPVTVYRAAAPRLQKLMKGLSSADLDIARRLEKLREDRHAIKSVPTEDEIARRLAVLKGQDLQDLSKKPIYEGQAAPETRSEEEQIRNLLTQFKEEVDIDGKQIKPEDEIAERLHRLRNDGLGEPQMSVLKPGSKDVESITLDEIAQLLAQCKMEASQGGKKPDLAMVASLEKLRNRIVQQHEGMDEDSSSDDEKAASQILSKVQAEVELEKQFAAEKVSDDEEEVMDTDNDIDDLPWCIICNEDAKIRCLGCDRDLYCKTCFQEGHTDEDMKSHSFEPFQSK